MESTKANVPPQGGRKHPHQDFLQIDTTNILFILGGAFDGLEEIVKKRQGERTMGFGAKNQKKTPDSNISFYEKVESQDLLKYGLIPEFVSRVPVVVALQNLDEQALIRILTEPKNALLKQYKKLFELDGVELEVEEDALIAIAKQAIDRKIGARGLRSILENIMIDIMYEIPSREDIGKVIIQEDCVTKKAKPIVVLKKDMTDQSEIETA